MAHFESEEEDEWARAAETYLFPVGWVGIKQPAAILVIVGLQPPVISRMEPRCSTAKDIPEVRRLAAILNLHELAHQCQVHAYEPRTAELVHIASLTLPQDALALLGDQVGEARAQARRGEVNLVKHDLTQVSAATEHIRRQRVVLVAGAATNSYDPAERLEELGSLLPLPELDELSSQRPRFPLDEEVRILCRGLGNLVTSPEVDLGDLLPTFVGKGMRAQVHLTLEQDTFVVLRDRDFLAVSGDLEELDSLGRDSRAGHGSVHEDLRCIRPVTPLWAFGSEEVVENVRHFRPVFRRRPRRSRDLR